MPMENENQLLREQINRIQSRYEEKIAELSMLREIGTALLHVRHFEKLCRLILNVIISNTIAQNCSIMLLDKEKDRLFLLCASNPEKRTYVLETGRVFSREGVNYGFRPGMGAAGKALLDKEPVLIQNARESNFFSFDQETRVDIGSLLCIPLVIEDEPFGVINLSHAKNHIFESNDVNLFNVISSFVAVAIQTSLTYEKLQASEEKYKALVENSGDGIAIIQKDRHVYSNLRYQVLTDYGSDELNGIPFSSLLDQKDSGFKNVIPDSTPGRTRLELGLIARGGKRIDVEIHASFIMHEGQEASLITLHDLTGRKELERSLIHAQKMEAIGTLAGGVAHDLNNILSGLVSYPELILMEVPEESPLRKPILTMKKSGDKAAVIVQDLLTLARRESASMEVVNLNHIALEYLKSPAYEKMKSYHAGIHLETDLDPSLSNMKGSSVHLFKTIMNLVSNAAEAMPDGGKITLSTKDQHVDKPINGYERMMEGDYVRLSVRDSGVGISPEEREKIFEPFYTKKKMGRSGTGLGMTVVWGTVKDHGGYIDIQSILGRGTTFHLFFPVTHEVMIERESRLPIDTLKGHHETILVVDDSEEQRDITSGILKNLGYEVSSVASGEEALEFVKKGSVDLVILDMIMDPGIDGRETYKRILERYPEQKAIIISGFSETIRVKEAQRLGAGKYLKKPYTLEQLGSAVKAELSEK